MPDQHREFYQQLPFLVIGSSDPSGWPWASLLFGPPGFVSTPTDERMVIGAAPLAGDPLATALEPDRSISVLGIELDTRRRNRMNGVIVRNSTDQIEIDVVQAFKSCPQYIQARDHAVTSEPSPASSGAGEHFERLSPELVDFLRRADTFFVASHNPEGDIRTTGGVDINHRGGPPGFIHVDGNVLTIPDYRGNFSFNTLGNFLVNPKAGLVFVDFERGDLIMLAGSVELLLEQTPEVAALPGAERAWRFKLDHGVQLRGASPLRWTFRENSRSFKRFAGPANP